MTADLPEAWVSTLVTVQVDAGELDVVEPKVPVDGEIDQLFIAGTDNRVANEGRGPGPMAVLAGDVLVAVVGEEKLAGENSWASGAIGPAGEDDSTVLAVVVTEQMAGEAVIERGRDSKPLVARFGGIPLRRQKNTVIIDRPLERLTYPRRELITRLQQGRCELCRRTGEVEVHHARNLAELQRSGPTPWKAAMTRRRRKTLVVCTDCHDHIHDRTPATFTA